jgi:hypothetical protein
MIAVRLRVTGHSQGEIENTLRQCAPEVRLDPNGHHWEDYAPRTARYVFSQAGDRQAALLEKYRDHWLQLEGREPPRDLQDDSQERRQNPSRGQERDRDMSLPEPPTRQWERERERERDHDLEIDL